MSEAQNEPTIESHLGFQGKILNVRVHTVGLRRGGTSIREIVEHSACVCAVAIEDADTVILVRQYRKPAEASLLEVPAGRMEPGESPEKAVLRELQEETGYTAGKVQHLSSFWISPGYTTEKMHVYLATDLRPGDQQPDFDEDIRVVKVPLSQVPEMVRSGQLNDAKSIASLLMAIDTLSK